MHWIQRHILKRLAFADALHYAELKPDGVEGNLFQYHGRELEKQGLITRTQGVYSLTVTGKVAVADLSSFKGMRRRILPMPLVALAAQNEAGQWLLFHWRRQPCRGLVSLPAGRYKSGRSLYGIAAEHLRNKTGYVADFEYLGSVNVISPDDHVLIQVMMATNLRGEHGSDGLTGNSFWGDPAEVRPEEAVAWFHPAIEWIKDAGRAPLLEIARES
jgi:ADP-ribose pyrophosphatase YjhB (NUDIX family)